VALTECVAAIDRPIALCASLDEPLGIREQREGMTEERPSIVTRNMRKRARRGRPDGM